MADPPDVALSHRLARALGGHDVHPDERAKVQDGSARAMSWNDVPEDVKQLVEEIERRPPR